MKKLKIISGIAFGIAFSILALALGKKYCDAQELQRVQEKWDREQHIRELDRASERYWEEERKKVLKQAEVHIGEPPTSKELDEQIDQWKREREELERWSRDWDKRLDEFGKSMTDSDKQLQEQVETTLREGVKRMRNSDDNRRD